MNTMLRTSGKITSRKERLSLTFILDEDRLFVGTIPYTWSVIASGDVETSNENLVNILDCLRRDVQQCGIKLTNQQCNDYLQQLSETGAAAFNKFLPLEAQKQISNFEDEQAHEQGLSLVFLDIASSPRSFLWELLYAGDPLKNPDPSQFWGFRYRLGRTYAGIHWYDNFHLRKGIFSAIHDNLAASKDEIRCLEEEVIPQCNRLYLRGIAVKCVEDCLDNEAVSTNSFIQFLVNDAFEYGIVHFACHCDNPQNTNIDHASLSITSHGKEIEISIEKLTGLKGRYRFWHQPFFFLNACESATPGHRMHKLSFPTCILNLGASGVIATACVMPDNFASAFGTEFYRCLLNKPSFTDSVYVGEALLETRLHFLNEYNNPLGLAYGLYATANQQLLLID
ncbi:MAG: CHAT domain-containing protein [Candidatus Competibacteraceae bacterium]